MPAKIKHDPRIIISTLWIVIMLLLMKADLLSLFIPGIVTELDSTAISTGASIPQLMLFGGIMGSFGIAMIFVSRFMRRGFTRWMNLIISPLYILYIIVGGTLYPHYIYIVTLEIFCLIMIFLKSLRWSEESVGSK